MPKILLGRYEMDGIGMEYIGPRLVVMGLLYCHSIILIALHWIGSQDAIAIGPR